MSMSFLEWLETLETLGGHKCNCVHRRMPENDERFHE